MTSLWQVSTPTSALHWANDIREDYARHAITRHCERVQRDQNHNGPDRTAVPLLLTPPGQYHLLQPHVAIVQNPGCCSCEPAYTDAEWKQIINKARIEQLAAVGHPIPHAGYQPPRRRQQPLLPVNDIGFPQSKTSPTLASQATSKQDAVPLVAISHPVAGHPNHGVATAMSGSSPTHMGETELPGAVPQSPLPIPNKSKQTMSSTAAMGEQVPTAPKPQLAIPTSADSIPSEKAVAVFPSNDQSPQGVEHQVPKERQTSWFCCCCSQHRQPHQQNKADNKQTNTLQTAADIAPVPQSMTMAAISMAENPPPHPQQTADKTGVPLPDKQDVVAVRSNEQTPVPPPVPLPLQQQAASMDNVIKADQTLPTPPVQQPPLQAHIPAPHPSMNSHPVDAPPSPNSHPSAQHSMSSTAAAHPNPSQDSQPQQQQQQPQSPPPSASALHPSGSPQVHATGTVVNPTSPPPPSQPQPQLQQQQQANAGQVHQQHATTARQHAAPIRDSAAEMPNHPQAAGSDIQPSSRHASTAGRLGNHIDRSHDCN